jgi:alkylation response protein AidB-like acyl-CoA dehydrogenase
MSETATRTVEAEVTDRLARLLEAFPPASTDPQVFRGEQYDAGLAWVAFSPACGGLDAPPGLQRNVDDAVLAAGGELCWTVNPIGYGMTGPTLAHWLGDAAAPYLRPLFTAEEVWCQLFSEPGAGSDVAALSTRAVPDGEEWVVNGQKVWTSLAHLATYGLLIARTDPDAVKHRGLTAFIVDMRAPGVDIRPLRQLTGDAEFNEIYFTDARIPDADRVAGVGDGWKVAITTLMNERVAIGGQSPQRGSGPVAEAVRLWQDGGRDPDTRDQLLQIWVRAEILRLTNIRARDGASLGTPGPEGSIGKLAGAELFQDLAELCVDLMGPTGALLPGGYPGVAAERTAKVEMPADLRRQFLRTRGFTIEGGTSEVMRGILAERVLGLPPEPRVDKDVPWKDVPR